MLTMVPGIIIERQTKLNFIFSFPSVIPSVAFTQLGGLGPPVLLCGLKRFLDGNQLIDIVGVKRNGGHTFDGLMAL